LLLEIQQYIGRGLCVGSGVVLFRVVGYIISAWCEN